MKKPKGLRENVVLEVSKSVVILSYVALCFLGVSSHGMSLETTASLSALGVAIGGVASAVWHKSK